jgi:hypothetical protein
MFLLLIIHTAVSQHILKIGTGRQSHVLVLTNRILYLQVNAEKASYTTMYREPNARQSHNKTIASQFYKTGRSSDI